MAGPRFTQQSLKKKRFTQHFEPVCIKWDCVRAYLCTCDNIVVGLVIITFWLLWFDINWVSMVPTNYFSTSHVDMQDIMYPQEKKTYTLSLMLCFLSRKPHERSEILEQMDLKLKLYCIIECNTRNHKSNQIAIRSMYTSGF